jgi:hypothetical protein
MKRILVKKKIIIKGKEPVFNELGEVIEMGTQDKFEAGEIIDQSEVADEGVEFFISQRPQYHCEVIDISHEIQARKEAEDKKSQAKEKLKTFDKSKITTVAGARDWIAELVEILK